MTFSYIEYIIYYNRGMELYILIMVFRGPNNVCHFADETKPLIALFHKFTKVGCNKKGLYIFL